ncbi:Lrp/AsnC family transcriptional regulator [Sphingopyxis sp.]|uniref:Lrp/AsnC family transcriptional regulator n=1 Tax=Sphingopyxis sp. TaxID=1908224 RepID=UPI001D29AB40|nr:Lrp/AsnC family transcriptional regulator [Sphingopyxis sp.]MBW8296063.1 Lrp/AsnC family transcriptional regulator [Sphingopyxis sp.]
MIDPIDRRILAELQADASLSNAELAERVGSSAPSCWRRVKALETAGILGPAVRLLDAAKVDCGVSVICNIRMRSHASDSTCAFEAFVHSRPEIMDCYSMSGDWDYLLRIVAPDVAGYERFLMRVLLGHPSVATASSHFALSQTKYSTRLPL